VHASAPQYDVLFCRQTVHMNPPSLVLCSLALSLALLALSARYYGICSLCSLRDQLLFPLAASTKGDALDAELLGVLQEVHLPDLVQRFKGDWTRSATGPTL